MLHSMYLETQSGSLDRYLVSFWTWQIFGINLGGTFSIFHTLFLVNVFDKTLDPDTITNIYKHVIVLVWYIRHRFNPKKSVGNLKDFFDAPQWSPAVKIIFDVHWRNLKLVSFWCWFSKYEQKKKTNSTFSLMAPLAFLKCHLLQHYFLTILLKDW